LAGNAFFQTPEFPVESFHLYSSKLTGKGALHTIECSYGLL
jgi:2'-5' RNA ligase